VLTVLTQMPAFISVNRSETLAHIGRRTLAATWTHSSIMSVPILKRARQRPQATSGKAILCEGIRSSKPYAHIYDMGFRMKTTLNIDDTVMAELKREAARQGRTMSELVETALRLLLASRRKRGRIPALPKFRSGGALVDVADRDALYHAMDSR